ncbi:MAG TPA: hypothetical protein VHC97_13365 [Thermoanaerobaculia bacterium]|jgi:hypothetical protein|nr:hypothetical protein [Thermoanaerobaculia bacterium]
MRMNKAVLVDPRLPPREVLMDDAYDNRSFLGCKSVDVSVPSYFSLFTERAMAGYRQRHGIPDSFSSSICLVYDDDYLKTRRELNKICSDLYSACRSMPWPILGPALIEYCSLEQLKIMYGHIPAYLALEDRIEEKYKKIILSRDAQAYDVVLKNLSDYY